MGLRDRLGLEPARTDNVPVERRPAPQPAPARDTRPEWQRRMNAGQLPKGVPSSSR